MSSETILKPAVEKTLCSPVRVAIVDVAAPVSDLDCTRPVAPPYTGAWILVCCSGRPLGSIEIPLHGEVIIAAELEHEVRRQLGDVEARLRDDDAVPLVRASVIVPSNFARPAQLRRCVERLTELDHPDYEVIVVDNRCGDVPLPEISGVRVVREPHPGISAARNRGIAVATGEIIAFTDDDVVVDRRWLRALGERFARQPDVSAVTGLVVPLELETAAQVLFEQSGSGLDRGFVPLTFERPGRFRVRRRAAWSGMENVHSLYLTGELGLGSNMAFRTSVLRAVGGFNEALGVGTPACGGEDLAMLIELLTAGHQLAYEPDAIIRHTHRATLAELERPDPWVWRGLHRDADRCYLARSATCHRASGCYSCMAAVTARCLICQERTPPGGLPPSLGACGAARPAYRTVRLPALTPSPAADAMRSPCSYKSLTVNAVSLMTATAANALGLVFWVNVGAGTLVAADEAVTQNFAFDTLYVGGGYKEAVVERNQDTDCSSLDAPGGHGEREPCRDDCLGRNCRQRRGSALILVGPGHWPALAGALLLACVPVGAAVMCWFDCSDAFAQAGLTLVLSLAVTAIASALMIWLATWHPSELLTAFAVVSVVSCVARLQVLRGAGNVAWRMPVMRRDLLLQLALLFIGLGVWAFGVSQVRRQAIGSFGLLASANVWFFLGLAVLLVGGLLELSRPGPRTWLICAYLAALIVAIHASVPLLYGTPEYAWVYKHIGVASAFGAVRPVTDPRISTSRGRRCSRASRRSRALRRQRPRFARWAPPAFELLDACCWSRSSAWSAQPPRRVPRSVPDDGAVAWVGQDYLSPQAFGFLIWLGVVRDPRALAAGTAAASRRGARAPARLVLRSAAGASRREARRAAGAARRRRLLRARRGAPAEPVHGARRARRADAARRAAAGLAAAADAGGDRGRVPRAPLPPDLPAVRRPFQRLQPVHNASGLHVTVEAREVDGGCRSHLARRRGCWPARDRAQRRALGRV